MHQNESGQGDYKHFISDSIEDEHCSRSSKKFYRMILYMEEWCCKYDDWNLVLIFPPYFSHAQNFDTPYNNGVFNRPPAPPLLCKTL